MTNPTDKTFGQESVLEGIIDRLEKTKAVIKTKDGQKLLWPIDNLPDDTSEGEVVELTLCTNKTKTSDQERVAKAVLNEILKIEDET